MGDLYSPPCKGVCWSLRARCHSDHAATLSLRRVVGSRHRVRSRKIGEKFSRGSVVEAFEPNSIIALDEGVEESVALGMGVELVLALVPGDAGLSGDSLGEAAIEALDETVGLWSERPSEAMLDAVAGTYPIEVMTTGGSPLYSPLCATEAVGEFGAVVGEDDADLVGKGGNEALEAGCDGCCIAARDDLDMDEAGGAVDGDEHEGGLPPTGFARSLPDFCNKIDPIRKSGRLASTGQEVLDGPIQGPDDC